MKKSRYTDEQIAFALKQAETGTPVAEVIRRMGLSEQTFYRWKKVYGGLGVGELRRLKLLEEENSTVQSVDCSSVSQPDGCYRPARPRAFMGLQVSEPCAEISARDSLR